VAALTAGRADLAAEALDSAGTAAPGGIAVAAELAEAAERRAATDGSPSTDAVPSTDAAPVAPWALLDSAAAQGSRRAASAAARVRTLRAEDPETAAALGARAVALAAGRPLDRARALLALGETLRRLRRPAAARASLREAEGLFVALGALPWAERAARELAATGEERDGGGRAGDLHQLTPQERHVALSVAAGRTNPEIAAELFLSRKTVEAHLTRVYRKLGVRSRVSLSRRMAAQAPQGSSSG
jgi:DNA-binding CsgD family transcriptional regulator